MFSGAPVLLKAVTFSGLLNPTRGHVEAVTLIFLLSVCEPGSSQHVAVHVTEMQRLHTAAVMVAHEAFTSPLFIVSTVTIHKHLWQEKKRVLGECMTVVSQHNTLLVRSHLLIMEMEMYIYLRDKRDVMAGLRW